MSDIKKTVILFYACAALAVGCRYDPVKFGYINAGDKTGDWIHYGELNDTLYFLDHPSVDFDLDENGVSDFHFSIRPGYHSPHISEVYFFASGNSGGEVCFDLEQYTLSTERFVLKLDKGFQIDDRLSWQSVEASLEGEDFLMYMSGYDWAPPQRSYSKGYWGDAKDKYFGFRLVSNVATYYGWIRIDLYNDKLILKDYAFRE